jgi:L-fucose isomerase-like protein
MLLYATGGRTVKQGYVLTPAAGAGAPGILEPMRAAGISFEFIHEPPDADTKVDEILQFAKVAKAVNDLKGMKLGSMGFGDMGLYTTDMDKTFVRNTFGVQTDFFDMLEVEHKAAGANKAQVARLVGELKKDWKFLGRAPKDETLERMARLTLAVRRIIKEKGLSAISLKCVEGMMAHMACSPCMVGTLIGDDCYYVCENDIAGMLGHVLLNSVSGEVATFVESYEFWDDRILFGVCGFLPPSMIKGQKQCKLFTTDPWEGLMNCSKMKTGRVTLIRPYVRQGVPRIHMVTGKAMAARKWIEVGFQEPGMHPSIELVLDGTLKHFIDHVPAQHFSIVYGDWATEVSYLCKLLNVELVYEGKRENKWRA